jgi:sortase family protein
MRRLSALFAALFLVAMLAVPAQAATVHRIFTAPMGGGGYGTAKITVYMDGSGRVDYALKGLKKSASYRMEVFRKSCGNLGTVVTRIPNITTTSTGTLKAGRALSQTQMNAIWSANWTSPLALRMLSGTSIKCGNLGFVHATKVTLPYLSINLPIVRAPSGYPYCNVAMYLGTLNQPTEPGVTFIMAHARKGMFLPLLQQWQLNKGANLIGKTVNIYTSNSKVSSYKITSVQTVLSIQSAVTVTAEQLWLQTSTGPHGTAAKLVVKAKRVITQPTTYAASHPAVHIVYCGY